MMGLSLCPAQAQPFFRARAHSDSVFARAWVFTLKAFLSIHYSDNIYASDITINYLPSYGFWKDTILTYSNDVLDFDMPLSNLSKCRSEILLLQYQERNSRKKMFQFCFKSQLSYIYVLSTYLVLVPTLPRRNCNFFNERHSICWFVSRKAKSCTFRIR